MLFLSLLAVLINYISWMGWQFFDGQELAAQHRSLFTPGIDASLLGWSIFHERLSGIWNYAILNQLSAWLFPLTRCWQWIPISLNWWNFLKSCCDVSYTLILKQKQRITCQLDWLVKPQLHAPSNRYALLSLWNPWTWETPALDLTRSNSWKISTCNAGSTPKPETKDNKHKQSFTNRIE